MAPMKRPYIYIYSITICFKLLHREGQSAMKNMINYNIKRLEHQPYIVNKNKRNNFFQRLTLHELI